MKRSNNETRARTVLVEIFRRYENHVHFKICSLSDVKFLAVTVQRFIFEEIH
jgi:hypothetical protein